MEIHNNQRSALQSDEITNLAKFSGELPSGDFYLLLRRLLLLRRRLLLLLLVGSTVLIRLLLLLLIGWV